VTRVLLIGTAVFTSCFLLAPLAVMALSSFSSTSTFALDSGEWSLRWYRALLVWDDFWRSFRLSLWIAGATTVVCLAIGIPLAFALQYGRFPGHSALLLLVLSPLMLPGIVIGIAALNFFRMYAGAGPTWEILLIHVVIALPYVVRVFAASLSMFDLTLIDAARTLGMTPVRAGVSVMLPIMLPPALASSVFAFLASFDNYSIALFLGNVFVKTLPVLMIESFEQSPDPTLAAMSTLLLALSILLTLLLHRLIGIDRIGSR
jgi:putative spermidine/putrescine transport system permease protein